MPGVPACFRAVCGADMKGIVAKLKDGLYTPEATTWVKVKTATTVRWMDGESCSRGGGRRLSEPSPRYRLLPEAASPPPRQSETGCRTSRFTKVANLL